MAVTLINSGANTTGLTTAAGAGPLAESGVIKSANYAAPIAFTVGTTVGGAAAACAIWFRLAGFSTGSTHRHYVGLPASNAITGDCYYGEVTFTASHLRDYYTIYKQVSGSPTALTPMANAFTDVSAKKIYFKRGKLTTSDNLGLRWVDNELQLWQIDPDGKGFLMGQVVDSSITTAGYCGAYLGTDALGSMDDIWSGTVPMKWVKGDGSDTSGTGTKASPYRQIRFGLHNTTAGGVTMVRTGTYGYVSNQRTYSSPAFTLAMPKGTSWYNPQVVQAYGTETATISVTGTDIEGVGFGITQGSMENAYHYWLNINNDGANNHPGPGWQFVSRSSKIRVQGGETQRHGTSGLPAVGVQSTHSNDAKAGHLSDYDVHWIDMNVHSQGYTHGFYPTRSGEVTEYCHIHENDYIGIQHQPTPSATVSSATRPIIRYNRIWGHTGRVGSAGIFLGKTINAEIYGNRVYDNSAGIFLQGNSLSGTYNGCSGTLVYNNVIYNNTNWGIENGYDTGGGSSGSGVLNTKIRNNCIVGNGSGTIRWTSLGPQDNGSNGTGNVESNNLTSDPGWEDPDNATRANAVFRLSSGTGIAIDTGYDTSAVMKTDGDGFPTAGQVMEVGPYLWVAAVDPVTAPNLSAPTSVDCDRDVERALGVAWEVSETNDPSEGPFSVWIVVSDTCTVREAP